MASMTPLPPTPAEIKQLLELAQDAKTTSYFAGECRLAFFPFLSWIQILVAALTFLVSVGVDHPTPNQY
jgi:hypothetical protein